jgi:molybdopterin/thiamine biosynthesis adenylyltransferase/rhodanese-related sulfurtransferase
VAEGQDPGARRRGELSPQDALRYQRQIILPQMGWQGQRRLLEARVALVGMGALGTAAAPYLAAAGVGTLGLIDADRVDLSNLQRQVLYGTADVGRLKVEAARDRLTALNPAVHVNVHPVFLSAANAREILGGYDLILNGSDNFPTRYLVNDVAVLLGLPLVDAAVLRFEGQLAVYMPGYGCYRCLFPAPPPPASVPSCIEAGVLGAVTGVLGSAQAVEAIKILAGLGRPTAGRLLIYDALEHRWREMRYRRNPACPVCGEHPTIREPIDYEAFCGLPPGAAAPLSGEAGLAPEQAQALTRQGGTILDLRSAEDFAARHMAGAVRVDWEDWEAQVAALALREPILCVCALGVRSAAVAAYLKRSGRQAYSLAGGMWAWAEAGLPQETVFELGDEECR